MTGQKKGLKAEVGAYHVVMCILVVPLIGVISLALDGFLILNVNVQQKSNAEYAALAALKEFKEQAVFSFSVRRQAATDKAAKVANSNFYLGNNNRGQMPGGSFDAAYGEIKFGRLNGGGFVETLDEAHHNSFSAFPEAVEVTFRTTDYNSIKSVL